MRCAYWRCAALPTTARSESRSENGRWIAPVRSFHSRMRRTDASIRAGVMSPRSTAALTAAIAPGTSAGISRMSAPAWIARTELTSFG